MYDAALVHVRAARLTDAELIYTPSQIALACLSLSADDLQVPFNWGPPKNLQHSEQAIFALGETIDQIKTVITQTGESPQVELVREVDRRLKLCKNPQRVVGSKAYLAIKEEEQKRAEQKKIRKSEGEDPFGDNLAGDSMDDDDEGN
jgi:cyclin H